MRVPIGIYRRVRGTGRSGGSKRRRRGFWVARYLAGMPDMGGRGDTRFQSERGRRVCCESPAVGVFLLVFVLRVQLKFWCRPLPAWLHPARCFRAHCCVLVVVGRICEEQV